MDVARAGETTAGRPPRARLHGNSASGAGRGRRRSSSDRYFALLPHRGVEQDPRSGSRATWQCKNFSFLARIPVRHSKTRFFFGSLPGSIIVRASIIHGSLKRSFPAPTQKRRRSYSSLNVIQFNPPILWCCVLHTRRRTRTWWWWHSNAIIWR